MTTERTDDIDNHLLDEAMAWLLALRDFPEDAVRRRQHADWLAADARHADAWARAQRVWTLAGQSPLELPRVPMAPEQAPLPSRHAFSPRWLAAGLAVAALVVLTALSPSLWLSWQSDYRNGQAETREVRLDDGSLLAVGANSAVRLEFSGEHRDIRLLKGQLFIEVADEPRPLRVLVDDVHITDIGTAFDVSLSDQHLAVAVENGAVAVAAPGQPVQSLRAGQRLRLTRDGYEVEHDELLPQLVGAWRYGYLVVDNQRIGDVIEQLRPYAPGMILLRDPALAQLRISGSYSLSNPAAALRAMVEPFQGRVVEISPWLVLVSA